jgi:molybdenum cofactor cytidylyltransferase
MICAIILAAGRSRRMGTQKLLLPFGGRTVIGHIVGEVLRSPIDEVVVVVGPDSAAVADALAGMRVKIVANPDAGGEMLLSVRCGLRAMTPDCEAVLVALGDQPTITARLIGQMLEAYCEAGRSIIVPVHGGRPGHPILFSTRYRDEIMAGYDDVGLCGLRRAHASEVLELPVADSSVLSDMDYPEDYRRALADNHSAKD